MAIWGCHDGQMDVGIRDLKARLSRYLGRVARGRDALDRGLAEGWITRQADRPPEAVVRQRPLSGTLTTTELTSQDRGA
jgi:hypothetical protein